MWNTLLSRNSRGFCLFLISLLGAVPGFGAPLRYDHIVVVIEGITPPAKSSAIL